MKPWLAMFNNVNKLTVKVITTPSLSDSQTKYKGMTAAKHVASGVFNRNGAKAVSTEDRQDDRERLHLAQMRNLHTTKTTVHLASSANHSHAGSAVNELVNQKTFLTGIFHLMPWCLTRIILLHPHAFIYLFIYYKGFSHSVLNFLNDFFIFFLSICSFDFLSSWSKLPLCYVFLSVCSFVFFF